MRDRDFRNQGRHGEYESEQGYGRTYSDESRGGERQWGMGREGRGYGEGGYGYGSEFGTQQGRGQGQQQGRESGWYGEGSGSGRGWAGGQTGQGSGWSSQGSYGGQGGGQYGGGQYGGGQYGGGQGAQYGSSGWTSPGYGGQSSQQGGYGGGGYGSQSGGYGSAPGYGGASGWGSQGATPGNWSGQAGYGGGWGSQSYGSSQGDTSGYGQHDTLWGNRSGWSRESDWSRERDRGREGRHHEESWTDTIKSFFGKGPKGYKRSDSRITEDVSDRLTEHPEVDASELSVRVQDGEVTLEGTVESRRQKHLAEDIAESVPGVRDVDNRIRVVRPGEMSRGQTGMQPGEGSHMISGASPAGAPTAGERESILGKNQGTTKR